MLTYQVGVESSSTSTLCVCEQRRLWRVCTFADSPESSLPDNAILPKSDVLAHVAFQTSVYRIFLMKPMGCLFYKGLSEDTSF